MMIGRDAQNFAIYAYSCLICRDSGRVDVYGVSLPQESGIPEKLIDKYGLKAVGIPFSIPCDHQPLRRGMVKFDRMDKASKQSMAKMVHNLLPTRGGIGE